MGKLGNARRKFVRVGLAAGLLGGVLVGVASSPVEAVREPGTGKNNPDLAASCGTDVILVLDESGSIASAGAIGQVESAVVAFVDGLNGTGSRMRIVEFATNARDATLEPAPNGNAAFQEVNDAFATKVDTYLAAGGEAGLSYNYNPGVGSGQQNTNWEAGLFEAANPAAQPPIGTGTGAPLVVFITDGNPNTIGTAGTSTPNNGGGSNASRDAAIEEIEALQGAGNHVLSVAVGNAFSDGAAYERLKNITEPNTTYLDVWEGTGPLDIRKTDVVGVQSFDALENALREVVFALCAPSVSINKVNQAGAAVPNWPFSLSVEELTDPAGGNPVGSEPFVWVTPSAGSTTAPSTESRTTDVTGKALFQWTPNSLADPKPWSSEISFSEQLLPQWQIDPSTYAPDNDNCSVKRLGVPDFTVDIVKTTPAGEPDLGPVAPGAEVFFKLQDNDAQNTDNDFIISKADIVSCTVKNIEPVTVRVVKQIDPDTDPGRFDLSINGAVKATDVGDNGGGATTDTVVAVGSTVTVAEAANSTTNATNVDDYGSVLSCPGATLDFNTGISGEFTAPLTSAGEIITCTFTNSRTTADLTVDKTWVNAVVDDAVSISIDGINDDTGSSVAETTSETDADVAGTVVYAGETVTLDETFTTGAAANYTETLACFSGPQDTPLAVAADGSFTVPSDPQDISCTFTNTRNSATLTLEKAWVNGETDDTAVIGIDGVNDGLNTATATGVAGTQVSPDTATATVFAGETVTLSEVLGATNQATYQSTLDCGGNDITLTGLSGTYDVPSDPDAFTCRFTNAADRGTIVIVKNAEGGVGTFDYTGDWAAVATDGFQITTAGTDPTTTGSVTYTGVLTGSYAVAETDPNPAWDLASLVCNDSDAQGTASTPNPAAQQLGGTINLDAGETVTCRFNNTKRGSITIVKDVTNTANGLSPNVFDFGGDLGTFELADNGVADANTSTFGNLVADEYTVTETDANANGFSLDSINCGNASVAPVTDGVTITLGVAGSVTCTFVNEAEGDLSITKTAKANQPVSLGGDSFSVTYDVVVTNDGPGATTYDLSDTPDFGTGADVTAIEVTLPGGSTLVPALPAAGGDIVTSDAIAGGASETYTVAVTFDVDPTMTKTDRTCVAGTAGLGTYNSATVTFDGGADSDNDCVTIPDPTPTITKTLVGTQPVAVDGDTFTVEYDITVANPGPGQTTYTLTDTPDFGPGATITGIAVELPGGALLDPVLPNAGGVIVTDDPIDGATSETYTVTATFDVAATMTATDRLCLAETPDRGAFNAASIAFPGGTDSDNACADIPMPNITTTKSVVAAPAQPVQVGTGFQYTVDYTVTVTNGGTGVGTYTLVDAPSFGDGTTINSIELIDPVPASANGAFGLGDLAIVKDAATLLPNETETFTVRATFTVAAGTTAGERDCDDTNDPATGTLNSVTVTPNIGDPDTDDACAPIPDPNVTVTKAVASGPTYDSVTDSYTISYDVVVTNSGSGPGTYDLVETPTFGAGTTITSVTLDGAPAGPPIVNPLLDDQPIAAGGVDTYVVAIGFTVDGSATSTARDCTLLPGEGGTGTLNTVTVTPNIGAPDDDDACGQIPSPGIGVVKTATADPVQVGTTNQYTVDYTITVTNTGPAAGTYTLVDQPKFGAGTTLDSIEVIAASPTAANPAFGLGDLAIVKTPADLLAGASDEFTIRATFTVAPGMAADQRDCTLGTDPGTGTFNEATVTPNIGDPSSDTGCRPIPNPNIDVEKTATTDPTYNSVTDTYSISYEVVVTNTGGPGTYDVAENPTFGGGTTITGITLDGARVALPVVNPIVDDAPIASGATVTYVVAIEFEVAGSASTTDRDCTLDPAESGTGTLNTVTVTPNIGDPVDGSDCTPIGNPDIEIVKTLTDGPTQTAPGSSTWTATYELQIDNNGAFGGSYDLTDDTGFATGLTITDQQATSADITINGDFNADVANTSIATGVDIAPGERDIVTVVVTFEYTGQVAPDDRICGDPAGPGDATYNSATATPNIGTPVSDDACGPVPDSGVSVDKTVSSGPVDNLDGTFTIVYEIDVTNADTAGAGEYDLADEATFSPGVTIESQAVTNTAPGSIVTDATFPTSGTIVAGETILPGASHTYEVTVVARLEVDTTTTYEECSSTTGAAGEGLFNRASLTVDGETTTDDVCADIPGDLMIEKSDGDVELAIGDGPFDYQLKVTNVGGASTGSPVIVTDVLPDEFRWVDFPDTAGEFPFCTQADQVLTCEIDSTLVDAGGESTDFLVSAEMRDGIAESIDGYENLSYVNSPSDPAPSSPSCEPQAVSSASSSDALIVGFATPTNNVACDRTPVRPSGIEPIEPPTTPPTTAPPTTLPTPTVPPEGLPKTGSSGSMNTLGLAALLLGLGVGLTLVVRRRQQQA